MEGWEAGWDVQMTQRKAWLERAISYCWIGSEGPVEVMVEDLYAVVARRERGQVGL